MARFGPAEMASTCSAARCPARLRAWPGVAGSDWAQSRCWRAGLVAASAPYRPLTEALLQALRGRPVPGDASLAPWLPALGAIIPGAGGMEHGAEASPAIRGEAVVQLLRHIADPGGMVVILEDLHWADPDTIAVVEYLAGNLAGLPVLGLATVRSETSSPALSLARRQRGLLGNTHLALERLDAEHAALMVRACFPVVPAGTASMPPASLA